MRNFIDFDLFLFTITSFSTTMFFCIFFYDLLFKGEYFIDIYIYVYIIDTIMYIKNVMHVHVNHVNAYIYFNEKLYTEVHPFNIHKCVITYVYVYLCTRRLAIMYIFICVLVIILLYVKNIR